MRGGRSGRITDRTDGTVPIRPVDPWFPVDPETATIARQGFDWGAGFLATQAGTMTGGVFAQCRAIPLR